MAVDTGLAMLLRALNTGGLPSYGVTILSGASFKPDFEGQNTGTLNLWIDTSTINTEVMSCPATTGNYYLYRYAETSIDKWRVRWPTTGTDIDEYTDGGTAGTDGTTVMLTIVREGGELRVYLNGTLIQTFTGLPLDDNETAGSGNLSVGTLNANVSDVGAWNRVLSAAEIQDLYTAGPSGWPAPAAGGGSPFSGFGGGGA
ncbi:MAG: LamG-like jellyroll fold domain-containing protein [Fuerstiella sp.]